MIHIVYSEDSYKLSEQISRLSKGFEKKIFDLEKSDLVTIHQDIATIDLFSNNEIYIFENIDVFEIKRTKLKKLEKKLLKEIFSLKNDYIIINNKKLNEKTEFFEENFNKIKYYEFYKKDINIKKELIDYLEKSNIKMTQDAIKEVLIYHEEISTLINDINKMWQYSNQTQITSEIINKVGINYISFQVFKLFELILQKKSTKAKKYYEILLQQGIEETTIFLIFISQLRNMYLVKMSMDKSNDNFKIAKQLSMNPYQVKMIMKQIKNIEMIDLQNLIVVSSQLDFLLKSGKINPQNVMNLVLSEVTK